ncbi:MAG: hypothetical protein A2445_03480 [Candidatus Jacksonbacteria bacterium RIFOXYC2_FULL_44_29]|nr:MAG: Glycosyl transferase group 1 [Parcubacteria group bacterium GW2011_GWA2_42_28]KKT54187.1 MAG: Glycosyl transferase group 1 [Parcubacteria group bacterium GW2011_GWC2_44_22]OGY74804.1 MAG: hypothetical protein A2240_02285 [Candidatus Jacksonbacteria bacterium RIFOXYA2_FULL_43_12]OGY77759.1 MAG: hypothetical protein A2295_03095 [Candidatus Jacksonbacteria bacterium RIFOXYB2_FULL_44_15]OGY78282.1 MAG: hypothetical protein A2445_03480 [Candidatus Jacksonbacteria bacterium RIFOXYC2_FULL_44_2
MTTIACDIRPLLEANWGGVSWYTYYLTRELIKEARRGTLRLLLFYSQFKKKPIALEPLFKLCRQTPNVTIKGYRLPNKLLNLSMHAFKFPWIDELLSPKIDYFILPNLSLIALSPYARRLAVCHDLSWEIFPEFFTLRQRLWHRLIRPRKFYQTAKKIIAVSQNTKQDLIDLYDIAPDKITVIYPGIDTHRFRLIKDTVPVRIKYQLPPDFLLFVGTLEPRKNLETLIEAYDLLVQNRPQVPPLVIVGPEGWKFDQIYRFWLRARSRDQIRFVNKMDAEDLPVIYNLARIFIYPSFYEGFGFPPLESMACGTPVIVGHGSSLPEIVADAGVLVDPYNIVDLALAIDRLLSDKQFYDKLKVMGLKRASEFTWEKMGKGVAKMLISND